MVERRKSTEKVAENRKKEKNSVEIGKENCAGTGKDNKKWRKPGKQKKSYGKLEKHEIFHGKPETDPL